MWIPFNKLLFFPVAVFAMLSCRTTLKTASQPKASIQSLRLLGEYEIPYGFSFQNTTVGGLSGIDYDAGKDCYYLICDDRSAINPARFYTARIFFTQKGIDSFRFTGMNYLLQPGGIVYPGSKTDIQNTPDPEAIRFDPVHSRLVWSSEGERIIREKEIILSNPAIRFIGMDGKTTDSITLPGNLYMQSIEKGPRQNSVFEGMSFAENFKSLFVSVEEPLYEDGPRADTMENVAYIRILKFDPITKKVKHQFAYKLEPVAYPAQPSTGYKINGVPDILSTGKDRLLVIERSYSTGRTACTVKLFTVNLADATDISRNPSLKENRDFRPAEKKLLLNMDELGIYIDNIEGVTFGPLLPNGHKTLLFVADNNFSTIQKSQLLLFEIIEK